MISVPVLGGGGAHEAPDEFVSSGYAQDDMRCHCVVIFIWNAPQAMKEL